MKMNSIYSGSLLSRALCFAALFLALSCSLIKEYPEEGQEVDPTLAEVTFNLTTASTAMETSVLSGAMTEFGYVKFLVEIYKGDFSGEPLYTFEEVASKDEETGNASVSLVAELGAGDYKLAAFAFPVFDNQGLEGLFDAEDLSAVTVVDLVEYVGSTDFRECYSLTQDVKLTHDTYFAEETVEGVLSMPVGRVEIVSDDALIFATKLFGENLPDTRSEGFWDDYSVEWYYELYFPVGYNVYLDEANRAEERIAFASWLQPLTDEEVLLGYDYVLVNGERTSVSIAVRIVNNSTGAVLNSFSGIKADVYRGRTTVITGEFLTTDNSSGVGINPGFEDGDINITL